MYPYLFNFWQFQVSSFWLLITICFFLFIWMLKRMSVRLDYNLDIFKNNITWFFISSFVFARIFYVFSKWYDYTNITNPIYFFIANEYKFSLMWWIFGFLLVLFILLKIRKESLDKYIFGLVLAFVFTLPLWFFWALLWGQVYGIDTNFWIEITYWTSSNIPYISPVFPLPIFYSILFFLLFSSLYIANMYINQKKLLWYAWMMIFSCIIFIMEFFSWKSDFFKDIFINIFKINNFSFINLSQICAIIIFSYCTYKVYNFYKKEINNE